MTLTMYHNPRCSKSRATLALIEAQGIAPEIVRYLDSPPEARRIEQLARLAGIPVRALLRTGEDEYRNATDLPDLDDDGALAAWLASHPRMLQRPIVVDDERGRAIVGRPPENVRALFR